MRNKGRSIKQLYSICVALLPLAGMYVFPGTKISIRVIVFLALIVGGMLAASNWKKIYIDTVYVPYLTYVAIHTILAITVYGLEPGPLILSEGQYLFFIFTLAVLNPNLFDLNICKKTMIALADISTAYLIAQEILAVVLGVYLPGGIPFLSYQNEQILTYVSGITSYQRYRARSLFAEPAAYAEFILIALILVLYSQPQTRKHGRNRRAHIVLYVSGIIISQSTSGVIALGVLALYFLYNKMVERQWKISLGRLFIALLIIIAVILVSQTMFIQYQIDRLSRGNLLIEEPRLRILANINALDLTSPYKIVFGHDFHLMTYGSDLFLTGFLRELYCFGVTGLVMLVCIIWKLYVRSSNSMQRGMLLIFLVLMLAGAANHGQGLVMYLMWMLSTSSKELLGISGGKNA